MTTSRLLRGNLKRDKGRSILGKMFLLQRKKHREKMFFSFLSSFLLDFDIVIGRCGIWSLVSHLFTERGSQDNWKEIDPEP